MTDTLYDILGVEPEANEDQIKTAYRKKAKEHHPDSVNGDRDKFEEIKTASMILLDPVKRKKYDETGTIDDNPDTTQSEAITIIMSILGRVLESANPEKIDVIKTIKETCDQISEEGRSKINDYKKQITKFENLEKRFIKKNSGPNIFSLSMKSNIKKLNESILNVEQKIKMIDVALGIIKDYEFEVDQTVDEESVLFKNLEDLIIAQMRKKRAL